MATSASESRATPLFHTDRRDAWWVGPLITGLVLLTFVGYGTFRAFHNRQYDFGHGASSPQRVVDDSHAFLLSPFFSPNMLPWFGDTLPTWVSPAFFILWAPGGFRLTCYYYRKAYYRSLLADPPGCAVGEGRKRYSGETSLFLFQNLHRYFLYIALLFSIMLTIDVIHACIWPNAGGGFRFGVSVGTLVLALNTTLLTMYTFSCHSLRHLVGGNIDCFSCVKFGAQRHKAWKGVSKLNKNHMWFAWTSLVMVGVADVYVWMVASGRITDIRLI